MSEINLKSDTLDVLNITSLINDSQHNLWVMNNTARIEKGANLGHVVFTIKSEDELINIMIPQTWAPINLASQADKTALIKSQNFRKAVNSRAIIVIKEAAALKALKDADCRAEHDAAQYTITHTGKRKNAADFLKDEEDTEVDKYFDIVHNQTYEVITREDITEDEQLASIVTQNRLGLITDVEKEFIMERSKFDKVKAFITNNT